jgi:predicted nucleotidyltransferase
MRANMNFNKDILNKIKNQIQRNKDIKEIILFGSRAKNVAKNGSDIDIAIIGNNLSFKDICDISANIEELNLPYKVDIINYNKITNSALLEHIKKVGIKL